MNKIFSIIIPTYNCSELLRDTLESIFSQDRNLFECIIVDGASKDNTINTILKYKKKYPDNVRYISEPDKGVYDAMNKGIDLSEGEYLYFIGAGDTLIQDCLCKIRGNLKFELEFVYGNVYYQEVKKVKGYVMDKRDMMLGNICHQSIFYNKKIFRVLGKYNLKYKIFSDNEFNKKCFSNDLIKKRYFDILICNYLGNGLSSNNREYAYENDYYSIVVNNFGSSALENVFSNVVSKKIIGWGTSGGYSEIKGMISFKIDYFVDSDVNKQGKKVDNIDVLSPKVLNEEDISNSYIIVFSDYYYDEISECLNKAGFRKYENYCLGNRTILSLMNKTIFD